MNPLPNLPGLSFQAIRAPLEAGRPILILVRNSMPSSAKARRLAAAEFFVAIEALRTATGIDLRDSLPDSEEIERKLAAAKPHKSRTPEGKAFENRYVQVVIAGGQVTLLVSTGTGHKLNEALEQPFVQHAAQLVRDLNPALVFANRIDRMSRRLWQTGPLINAIEACGARLGTGEFGILPNDQLAHVVLSVYLASAEREAKTIFQKSRRGQASGTATTMIDGVCVYSAAPAPPAGFRIFQVRGPHGLHRELRVDTPSNHPDPSITNERLPQDMLNGVEVDQVHLVREALRMLGDKQQLHSYVEIGRWLAERGYATERLRQYRSDVAANWIGEDHGSRFGAITRSIVNNIDVYRTGEWRVRLGHPEIDDVIITGMFPPDGKLWADDATFDNIDERLHRPRRKGGPATMAFVGVRVTDNGRTGLIRRSNRASSRDGAHYMISWDPDERASKPRLYLEPIPHAAIAASIVDALASAADQVWVAFVRSESPSTQLLRDEIKRLRQARDELLAEQSNCITWLLKYFKEPGAFPKALEAELNAQAKDIEEHKLPKTLAALAQLEADLAEHISSGAGGIRGIADDMLLNVIASLRDPLDVRYQKLWRECLEFDSFAITPFTTYGLVGRKVTWTGHITLTGAGQAFRLAFGGEHAFGAAADAQHRVDTAIAAMATGIPLRAQDLAMRTEISGGIIRTLCPDKVGAGIVDCRSGRSTKVGTHILLQPDLTDVEIATITGEPRALVTGVRAALHGNRATRWLKPRSKRIAAEDAEILRDTRTMAPCQCGDRRRIRSRLPEAHGRICLGCLTDEAGVPWTRDDLANAAHLDLAVVMR